MSKTAVTLEFAFAVNSARCPREMFPGPITPVPMTSFAPRILPCDAAATANAAREPTSRRVYVPMAGILDGPNMAGLHRDCGTGQFSGFRTACSRNQPRKWLGDGTVSPSLQDSAAVPEGPVRWLLRGRPPRGVAWPPSRDAEDAAGKTGTARRPLAIPTDVRAEGEVEWASAEVVEWAGRLDVPFDNAGGNARATPIETLSLAAWQQVVDVDPTGMFLCKGEAVRCMKRQVPRGRRIINSSPCSKVIDSLSPSLSPQRQSRSCAWSGARTPAADRAGRDARCITESGGRCLSA